MADWSVLGQQHMALSTTKIPEDFDDIDFLFISHAHDDHLHPESS